MLLMLCDDAWTTTSARDVAQHKIGGNRHRKLFERSRAWLDATLSDERAGRHNLIATVPVLPSPITRAHLAHVFKGSLSQPEGDRIRGFAIRRTPHATATLVSETFAALGAPERLRMLVGSRGPHEMLDAIASGSSDVLVDEWSAMCADEGVELSFTFGFGGEAANGSPATDNLQSGGDAPMSECGDATLDAPPTQLGLDLFSDAFEFDKTPLSAAGRAHALFGTPSEGGREIGVPTRAYIHHLLHAHEMAAHVLLALHNHAHMASFMVQVRQSILDGTFERRRERFESTYRRESTLESRRWQGLGGTQGDSALGSYACIASAAHSRAQVHAERGKGSLKERRRKDASPSELEKELVVRDRLESPGVQIEEGIL